MVIFGRAWEIMANSISSPAFGPAVNPATLDTMLSQALAEKPPEHLFRNNWQPHRVMTAIGG